MLKFRGKITFEGSMNKTDSQEFKILTVTMFLFCWGSRRILVDNLYVYNRLSVIGLFQGNKYIRIIWKPGSILVLYDVDQLIGLVFTINDPFLNYRMVDVYKYCRTLMT